MRLRAAFGVAAFSHGMVASGDGASSSSGSCAWPNCTTGTCYLDDFLGSRLAEGCEQESVGTCTMSMAKVWTGCKVSRGPTDCFMGQCICKTGYCASPNGPSGRWCAKRRCDPGPPAPLYQPTDWVAQFADLGQSASFPPPNATEEERMEFVEVVAKWPLALCSVGLGVGLITFLCLCCSVGAENRLAMRGRRLLQKGQQDPRLLLEEAQDEPSMLPMLCMASLILVVNIIAIIMRMRTWQHEHELITETMGHLKNDTNSVSEQSELINRTVKTMQHTMLMAPETCHFLPSDVKQKITSVASNELAGYCDKAEMLYNSTKPLPGQVDRATALLDMAYPWLKWGPLLPMIIMMLMSGSIVVEAVLTKLMGTACLARCEDCGLRIASVLFFLVIMAVSMIAAAELGAGIAISLFCVDVEANLMSYLRYALDNQKSIDPKFRVLVFNLSSFYVYGFPASPLVPEFQSMQRHGRVMWNYYWSELAQLNKDVPEVVCPGLENVSVKKAFLDVRAALKGAYDMTRAQNAHPYYQKVVHKGMCGSLLETMGHVIIVQVIAGLILFPACAVLTHRFLGSWSAWKTAADPARQDEAAFDASSAYTDSEEEGPWSWWPWGGLKGELESE